MTIWNGQQSQISVYLAGERRYRIGCENLEKHEIPNSVTAKMKSMKNKTFENQSQSEYWMRMTIFASDTKN